MLLVMLLFKLYFFTLLLILDKDASLIKVILYRIFSAKADNLYLPILPISWTWRAGTLVRDLWGAVGTLFYDLNMK